MNELPSLYVSGLPKESFFDLDFFKFFKSRGFQVKNAKIVIDSKTNKSRAMDIFNLYKEKKPNVVSMK